MMAEGRFSSQRCGKILSETIIVDGLKREYFYYIPSILCDATKLRSFAANHAGRASFYPFVDKINIPILMTLCGIGGFPEMFLKYAVGAGLAEKYGLIQLVPRGGYNDSLRPSWNAGACCGDNLAQKIDDTAFIREMLYAFVDDLASEFDVLDLTVPNLALFITGYRYTRCIASCTFADNDSCDIGQQRRVLCGQARVDLCQQQRGGYRDSETRRISNSYHCGGGHRRVYLRPQRVYRRRQPRAQQAVDAVPTRRQRPCCRCARLRLYQRKMLLRYR